MTTRPKAERTVHIVSHGPHCLDGVAAAVAIARFHEGARIIAEFAANPEIDGLLRSITPTDVSDYELWITDISWRERATDDHLRTLAGKGVRIYWFDHHRSALKRHDAGAIKVPFSDLVVSEEWAASRLVYDYLARRLAAQAVDRPAFRSLARLIEMADDNDRWLHRVPGSRELALVVRSLGPDSYEELLRLGPDLSYTPRMAAAHLRIQAELERSFGIADATCVSRQLLDGTTLMVAVCDGYTSEVADRWGKKTPRAVFALYDAKGLAVSLRRSPDCDVDLSRVAERLGGGGHAAAAGCELPEARTALARIVGDLIATAISEAENDQASS